MNQQQVDKFVSSLPSVESSEAFGYHNYFYGGELRIPFLRIANSESMYEERSNLKRKGVFRVDLSVRGETFRKFFSSNDINVDALDYTQLNQFMPHPEFWRQNFLCILNPAGPNKARLEHLIREAYELSKWRYEGRGLDIELWP